MNHFARLSLAVMFAIAIVAFNPHAAAAKVFSDNVASWKELKRGDRVAGWRVLFVRPAVKDLPISAENFEVRFIGKATVRGTISYNDVLHFTTCMEISEMLAANLLTDPNQQLEEDSQFRLPRIKEDTRSPWFCFSNEKFANKALGGYLHGQKATVTINRFTVVYFPGEAANEARLKSAERASQVTFDGCGKLDSYKPQSWYDNFIIAASSNNYDIESITDACYSENGKTFIALIPGGYGEGFSLLRFNTERLELDPAHTDWKNTFMTSPTEFGKRVGNVIQLQGRDGDAGCSTETYFDYNFARNLVEVKKTYTECDMDEAGDSQSGEWRYY